MTNHALLARIKGRCRIDDLTGCWLWSGAKSSGKPSIFALDLRANKMRAMSGSKAVWQAYHGVPLPVGGVTYMRCWNSDCVRPEHAALAESREVLVAMQTERGIYKTPAKRAQALKMSAGRRKVTPDAEIRILTSDEPVKELARELGVSASCIFRWRQGIRRTAGGMFSGLIREAA